jgi:hypothetical protein
VVALVRQVLWGQRAALALVLLLIDVLPLLAGEFTLAPLPATPTPTPVRCVSDCDGNSLIAINEVIRSVAISLEQQPLATCTRADGNGNGRVSVDELVQGVLNNLHGCGVRPPTATRTATATVTPVFTATSTTTATATVTATATATQSLTVTRTATGTTTPATLSVCGGTITSVPKLCNVEVVPNPVPLFGVYRVRYCLSDNEGDLRQACIGIRTGPQPPIPTCEPLTTGGGRINGCFESTQRPSTEPVGSYGFIIFFDDFSGNRSNTVEAPFTISASN